MPIAYPAAIRPPLRASRTRTQAASFSASDPTRGFARFDRTGFDQPVAWDLTWRLPTAEAQLFVQWFVYETLRGALPFTIDLRTEFGLIQHECRFMPGGLLNARQDGATWVYTATIMARAQIIPSAAVTAYGGAFVGPIPAQTVTVGVPFTLSLASFWSGGLGPFTWAIASGMLPPGVALDAVTGVVSGAWFGTTSIDFNDVVFSRQDLFGVRRHSNQVDFAALSLPRDPFYANVVLLIGATDVPGNTSFPDRSPNPSTVTNAAPAGVFESTAQALYGTTSIRFDAAVSGTRLNVAWPVAKSVTGADKLYTAEWSMYVPTGQSIFAAFAGPLIHNVFSTLGISLAVGGSTQVWSGAGIWTFDSWNKVAVCRNGDSVRFFVNGILRSTITFSSIYTQVAQEDLFIGRAANGTAPLTGWLDELRITKGVARYSADYTPSNARFPRS
jgi:hypothetical protein